jgi:hypothetical protein
MNEKITELAKQAHETCFENPYCPNYSRDRFNKEFAELIIKECIKVSAMNADLLSPTQPDMSYGILSNNISLRKHFGMENDKTSYGNLT